MSSTNGLLAQLPFAPRALGLLALMLLSGCPGSSGSDSARSSEPEPPASATYSVGVTVSGLPDGEEIRIDLSDLTPPVAGSSGASVSQSMTVGNGSSVFPSTVPDGTIFAVHANLSGEAATLRCDTRDDSLRTITGADITGIDIDCDSGHLVGGTIEGLEGGGLFLRLRIDDGATEFVQSASSDGSYSFAKPVLDGEQYEVDISTQPTNPDQICVVSNERGVVSGAEVSNVDVACGEATIGYVVNGLSGGGLRVSLALEIEMNGAMFMQIIETDDVTENGEVTFDTLVRRDERYHVTVYQQPSGPDQECSVREGEGTIDADTTVVEVRCPEPLRMYRFDDARSRHTATPLGSNTKLGGVLDESFVFGPGPAVKLGSVSGLGTTELFQLRLDNDAADGIVFSNLSGYTYWLAAESRSDWFLPGSLGTIASTQLATLWRFRKVTPAATFRLELSQINMLGYHDTHFASSGDVHQLTASAFLQVTAHRGAAGGDLEVEPFYSAASDITLVGRNVPNASGPGVSNAWNLESQVLATADLPIWSQDDFVLNPNAGVNNQDVATAQLAASKFIDIDVSSLSVGAEFGIVSSAIVTVSNLYTKEGGSVVYLRDPAAFDPGVDQGGITIETEGLVLLDTGDIDLNSIRLTPSLPAPACDAPGADQSVLEFSAAEYRVYEGEAYLDAVNVTRGGNDSGLVSASVILTSDTATVDTDFEAGDLLVRFGDGSTAPRTLALPIIEDDVVEPDETLTLTLVSPGGCAVIGARDTATVTIVDDDAPPPSPNFYTVGGSVSGLAGSGLQLSNIGSDNLAVTANGPFSFPRETPDGISYEVRVASQPVNPGQSCAVTNGSGRMAGADVGNVEVDCTTLPPDAAGLDPDFGSDGKLTVPGFDAATDIALQSDGKIVAVGGDTVSRYTTDGELDTGFGAGGSVIVNVFDSSDSYDVLEAVAVQPDGQIVVAGSSRDGANAKTDVIVVRYDTNGVLDPTFGNGGSVVTDGGDVANDVLIQPDGAIVIAGHAAREDTTGISGADFLAIRYRSSGALDTSFGNSGITTTNIAGRTDIAYAVALQIDGKLVVTGRVANTGGDDPDIGVVRYDVNGVPDPTFGSDGIVRVTTPDWDEAADIVVQADGSIVVAGFSIVGASTMLTVARFDTAGTLDAGFGTDGVLLDPIMERGNSLALQTDGQTIVVGSVGEFPWDLAIARLNAIGGLDTNFGESGLLRVDFFGGSDAANAVAIQPDGKIVAGGYAVNGTQTILSLVRVLP